MWKEGIKEDILSTSRLTDKYISSLRNFLLGLKTEYAQTLRLTINKNILTQENKLEPTYKAWALFHNISVDEFKRKLQKLAEKRVAESNFFIQVDRHALSDILEGSGKFKNQYETGISSRGRAHMQGAKKSAELSLFGISMDAKPEHRPTYGYISDDPNGEILSNIIYGDIVIKFNRKKILPKTTVTFGDSWNNWGNGGTNMIVPTPAEKPHFTGVYVGAHRDRIERSRKEEAKKNDPLSLPESSKVPRYYYEAQYHGGITKDFIESIHVSKKALKDNKELNELIRRMPSSIKIVET